MSGRQEDYSEYEQQQSPHGYAHGRGQGYGNYADRSSTAPGSGQPEPPEQQQEQLEQLEQQEQQELQQGPDSQP